MWLLAIIIIASLGNNSDNSQPTTVQKTTQQESTSAAQTATTEPPQEAEATPKEEPKEEVKTEFKVGETIQFDDYYLVVNEVKKSNGSQFDKPKSGMEYVIITVTIASNKDKNISYNPFDFKMQNSQGQILQSAFTTVDSDTSLQSGELAPGGKVSGTIAFEQPKGDPDLTLIFQPNMFLDDHTVKVKLQ